MRSRPTIPLTTISTLRSLRIIVCVVTIMITAEMDIVNNDNKIATRTGDNTAYTLPENIPFVEAD